MTDFLWNWVWTSSLLILAVALLRGLFGRRISAGLRYALWALVLARLLIPGQFYTAPIAAPRLLPESGTLQAIPAPRRNSGTGQAADLPDKEDAPAAQVLPREDGEQSGLGGADSTPSSSLSQRLPALSAGLWIGGSGLLALVFLWSNLAFARKLRRVRRPLEGASCPLPVYTAPGLPSPCLFGPLRPAVYVTAETAADPAALRHILAHETTHFRHGDHLWALLRCLALAVHWWNPLVWLAAVLSRRDGELACDEGALKVLGDPERRAYGNTLLALVTAKAGPGDLLRCATTMSGGKRSLRERISRIARAPRRWLWAAVVSIALACLVCACSFARAAVPKAPEDGPLTEEELARFNGEVFNGEGFSFRNQLLFLAVEAPKDYRQIDLYQLFYNGTGEAEELSDAERQAVVSAGYGGEDPGTDLFKCSAARMDALLRENLGLGLEDTDQWGLDQFTYLPEYDAYYTFHSDTNYPGEVRFTSGERKDGKLLLYYEGTDFPVLSSGDGSFIPWEGTKPVCLTLEEQADGGLRFLTNWPLDEAELPSPTAYPSWEPERVIPLDKPEPYWEPGILVEVLDSDNIGVSTSFRFQPDEFSDREFRVMIRQEEDGGLSAGVRLPDGKELRFLTVSAGDAGDWTEEESRAHIFDSLFGRYGVTISYNGWINEHYYGAVHDYYIFDDDGMPSLLVRAYGEAAEVDLDGDGINELTSPGDNSFFFQRDGRIYRVPVDTLVSEAWPEAGYTEYGWWDPEARYLPMTAQVPVPGAQELTATAFRTVWFDGESLRIYKDETPYADHVKTGVEAPPDVLSAARDFVRSNLALLSRGTGGWDDWRLTELEGPWMETVGDISLEIWRVGYEVHTSAPEDVILAGGSYLGEDGWSMIGYPGCDYLYFQVDGNGARSFLVSFMVNDCQPGSDLFREDLARQLRDMGLVT